MRKTFFLVVLMMTSVLAGCDNSSTITISAYGCEDKVESNQCKGKPTYLGDISLIISKEGKSVKMTQSPAKGSKYLMADTFIQGGCIVTNNENWSCKSKSPYGELYFIYEMIDGFYISSMTSDLPNLNGITYVGYQGIKGQLIKYGLWHPTDIFKEGKA